MCSSSSNAPLLGDAGGYGAVVTREYAARTKVYGTRWYILALFSLLGLFQVRQPTTVTVKLGCWMQVRQKRRCNYLR